MNNEFLPRRGFRNNDFPRRPGTPPPPGNPIERPLYPQNKQLHPHPDAFRTPDVITAADEHQPQNSENTNPGGAIIGHHQKPKKTLKERLKSITKKQWIIISVVAVFLLGGVGFAAYYFLIREDAKPAVVKKEEPKEEVPPPAPLYATLTGLPITDAAINDRPVTAI